MKLADFNQRTIATPKWNKIIFIHHILLKVLEMLSFRNSWDCSFNCLALQRDFSSCKKIQFWTLKFKKDFDKPQWACQEPKKPSIWAWALSGEVEGTELIQLEAEMALRRPDSILSITSRRFLSRQSLFNEVYFSRTKYKDHKLKQKWLQFDINNYFSAWGQPDIRTGCLGRLRNLSCTRRLKWRKPTATWSELKGTLLWVEGWNTDLLKSLPALISLY